ncbi:hypothetical protein BJ170DRAFT_677156 [Xylariales sp. AK1849]|nr:hypothetical protein BJ170DRAFT_677156 [Xylariales sp. AK1849]
MSMHTTPLTSRPGSSYTPSSDEEYEEYTPKTLFQKFVGRRISDEQQDHTRIEDIRAEVRDYFTQKYNFEYIKGIGDGGHGGTGLFKELDPYTRQESRRLVIKFSLDSGSGDKHLLNEAKWLKLLGGREHVISALYIDEEERYKTSAEQDAMDSDMDTSAGFFGFLRRERLKEPSRPTLVLEYLPGGDLEQLRDRFAVAGAKVPNRLLWRFTLCLLRALVGFAYYERIPAGERERIPADNPPPSRVCHNSMKGPNTLLGAVTPGDPEHGLVPSVKIIDFGRTAIEDEETEHPDGYGAMSGGGRRSYLEDEDNRYTDPYTKTRFRTTANEQFIKNDDIAKGIKTLVCRLMALRAKQVIGLSEALMAAEKAVGASVQQNFSYYPGGVPANETDEAINELVKELVFDAPVKKAFGSDPAQHDAVNPFADITADLARIMTTTLNLQLPENPDLHMDLDEDELSIYYKKVSI